MIGGNGLKLSQANDSAAETDRRPFLERPWSRKDTLNTFPNRKHRSTQRKSIYVLETKQYS